LTRFEEKKTVVFVQLDTTKFLHMAAICSLTHFLIHAVNHASLVTIPLTPAPALSGLSLGLLTELQDHVGQVTGLTNYAGGLIEDAAKAGRGRHIPYSVEDALKELGAQYEHGEEGSVFTVVDGNLISGVPYASMYSHDHMRAAYVRARSVCGLPSQHCQPSTLSH
jgi:hypothetical protein